MANGQVPSWDQWQTLSGDQKEYEQHRVLLNLDGRLKCVEKRKKLDTGLSLATAGVMGFFGGLIKSIIK